MRPIAVPADSLPLVVSTRQGEAVFAQIAAQLRTLIEGGRLQPGVRLPPVRSLARQLKVNPITVGRAYRALVYEGLLQGRRGGGTLVASAPTDPIATADADEPLLAERLFELARAPGVIAFTSNYPLSDTENTAALRACLDTAIRHDLVSCLHYEPPIGRESLRTEIARYLLSQRIRADEQHVLVTSGGQQALDLAIRSLVPAGANVVIESPAYYGAINILRNVGARTIEVPVAADGMDLDRLETIARKTRVSLVCVNPTFQNPTGATMSESKRVALLAMARQHGFAILEDDHAPELRFRGAPVPALRALADPDEPVFYTRGFGKAFLPGMRLGFLVMPDAARGALLHAKVRADMHCPGLLQEAGARYFAAGHHLAFAARLRRTYAPRRRILFEGLRAGLPDGVHLSDPDGGLSLWLTLPERADTSELYYRAVRRGVAFVSGDVFHLRGGGATTLRLSFGLTPPEALHDGIQRLCSVVEDVMVQRAGRGLILT